MKHQFKQRIIYKDTDAAGVVYYANYLKFFEQGRTELLRDRGISIKATKEKHGVLFAVTKVECDYLAPALHEDEIAVTTEIVKKTSARLVFKQEVLREGQVLVSALITLCSLSVEGLKPTRLPFQI